MTIPANSEDRVESGTLYVVATPIGNLGDIGARAIEILNSVSLVAAEDTRHSAQLFSALGINNRLVSFHDFSSENRLSELLDRLRGGDSLALISDAGTPAISDPGFELVRQARQESIPVVPVPGPSALTAALSVAGLASDRFVFEGFLPARSHGRRERLALLRSEVRSLVIFESPHRIVESLTDMAEIVGADRQMYLGRELTKRFETSMQGTIAGCLAAVSADPNQRKGEFVLVVEGQPEQEAGATGAEEGLRVLSILLKELSLSQAVKLAARISGVSRNQLYQAGLELSESRSD